MRPGRTLLRQAGALLCAALIMVFVQAAAASIVAKLQHALSGPDHQHMLFTDLSFDDNHHAAGQHHDDHDADHHHDGDHDAASHGGDGHHHHHGDVGASVMVLSSPPPAWLHDLTGKQQPDPGRLLDKVRHVLPDRPPRALSSQA